MSLSRRPLKPSNPQNVIFPYGWYEWIEKEDEFFEALAKQLRELLENIPKYPDTVGGMYPVEVQMYACDVDEFVEKVKQVLEALE